MAQLLRAHQTLDPALYDEMYYWGVGKDSIEVDFLLQRGRGFTAIEVKARERLDPAAFAGLKAIGDLPGVTRRILVHLGELSFRHEAGIEAMPFERFFAELDQGL